jgi:serine/threonine protein kinase
MIGEGVRLKDRYRLERLLGRGGMASVWLAGDDVLERSVAIKVLADTIASDPEFLARFRREARIAASLSHPNLIGVYDYAEGDERPYLVMEYVPGENLAERMEREIEIDCERLARELLGALAHIHAAGIVHRDVKPGNVLIAPDGSAKLIDFGIALSRDATSLTRTGHLLGTARYIAPEVMAGAPATELSDLYSCGIVLRNCGGDRSPGRLPPLVARLASEDPRDRPASAAEALAEASRKASARAQPTERFSPTFSRPQAQPFPEAPTQPLEPRAAGSARGRTAAAVTAALVALAIAFFVVTGGSSDAPQGKGGKSGGNSTVAGGNREAEAATTPETEATAAVPTPTGTDLALASSLNQKGFEMLKGGAYEEAIPVLEEAIRAFPPGTEDVNYAYALFNLGNALRLSGHPEEAIPVLERRLEIPNQIGAVSRELAAARSEAGL